MNGVSQAATNDLDGSKIRTLCEQVTRLQMKHAVATWDHAQGTEAIITGEGGVRGDAHLEAGSERIVAKKRCTEIDRAQQMVVSAADVGVGHSTIVLRTRMAGDEHQSDEGQTER